MRFLEASAEMTRWLLAHAPSMREQTLEALLGQRAAGYLLWSHKQVEVQGHPL